MSEPTVRSSLSMPVTSRRPRISFDADAVGRYSESIARFFGTGTYLLIQTIIVIVWIIINVAVVALRFDPYPFILLNLAFSTQAAYAAPLILLAQNRQEDRDKESVREDRLRATQTKADTEFLARELASVRLSVGETVTRDYLRRELDDLRDSVERIETLLSGLEPASCNGDHSKTDSDMKGRGSLGQDGTS